ncbi:MAG TPA: hypothetical protein EYP10_07705 [Armatimonadetes bacterium]|nr:hypothetical protein [Armatimonadota bacterium]
MAMSEEAKLRRKLQQVRLERIKVERHLIQLERRMSMQRAAHVLRRDLERLEERRAKLIEQEEKIRKQLEGEPAEVAQTVEDEHEATINAETSAVAETVEEEHQPDTKGNDIGSHSE